MEKVVSKMTLVRLLAKNIKHNSRIHSENGVINLSFTKKVENNITWFIFGDNKLGYKQILDSKGFRDVITEAMNESSCHGRLMITDDGCDVLIYMKPCREFELLNCTLKKITNFELGWDMIRVESKYADTKYLAFNKEACKNILKYIRGHRRAHNKLSVEVIRPKETNASETVQTLHIKSYCHGETIEEKDFYA